MSAVFVEQLSEKLKPLNELKEELEGIGLESLDIKLPSIASVGDQSAGKSSVIESIVGEDFLPKASELATRVSIRLRLVREHASQCSETYAVIKGCSHYSQITCKLNELTEHIRECTNHIAGDNSNIVNEPISIEIHAQNCPELTLIDLPGIARIAKEGSDQPENIEAVTKGLISHYIDESQTIILSVVAANTDPSGSAALQMAKQVDPEGKRTIGVFTKTDIMDRGSNAKKMLNGEYHKLKLGYVGVKNRSQQDLDNGMTVKEALAIERRFFAEHPVYRDMDSKFFGANNLSVKLMEILKVRIEESLPGLLEKVNTRRAEVVKKLDDFGDPLPTDPFDQQKLLVKLIKDFTNGFQCIIMGNYENNLPAIVQAKLATEDTFGAAQIRKLYSQNFGAEVQRININELSNERIERIVTNIMGASLPDFPPFSAFRTLLGPFIDRVQPLAKSCLETVFRYIQSLAKELCRDIFGNYPALLSEVSRIIAKVLYKNKDCTNKKIVDVIKTKKCIYTESPQYIKHSQIKNDPSENPSGVPISPQNTLASSSCRSSSQTMKVSVEMMRTKLTAYYDRVFKPAIRDLIPQTIDTFLLGEVAIELDVAFLELTSNVANFGTLLEEPSERQAERAKLTQEHEILLKAHGILSQFSFWH
eukprot:Phypoly_transcript_03942.p1 GENE.Phypoly_transcript_03942~~Phypoly_transcript_03942.p1  ORF type:complete len:648 (+),score=93.92 Phypoly_transcript_03942:279-2222(+)